MFLQIHSRRSPASSLRPKALRAALCAAFLLLGMPVSSQTEDKARTQWLSAYLLVENAEKALGIDRNELAALQMFKEARDIFLAVQKKYPDWNPALLAYRIDGCARRIAELERKTSGMIDKLSQAELVDLATRQAREMQNLSDRIRELKNNLAMLQDSIDEARQRAAKVAAQERELADAKGRQEKLRQDNTLLLSQVDQLRKTLDTTRKDFAATKEGRLAAELDLFRKQNKNLGRQLQDRTEEWKKTDESLKRRTAEKEHADKLLAGSAAELTDARKRDAAQRKEIQDLGRRIAAGEQAGRQADARIEDLRKTLDRNAAELAAAGRRDAAQKKEIRELGRKAAAGEQACRQAEARIEDLRKDLARRRDAAAAQEKELQMLRDYRAKFVESRDDALSLRSETGGLQARIDAARKENQDLRKQLAQLKAQNKGLKHSLQDGARVPRETVARLQAELQASRRNERELAGRIQALERKRSGGDRTLDKYEKIAVDATGSEKKALAMAAQARERLGRAERELADCQARLKDAAARLAEAEGRNKEMLAAGRDLGKARKTIRGLEEDLERLKASRAKDIDKAVAKADKAARKRYAGQLEGKDKELADARRQLVEANSLASRREKELQGREKGGEDHLSRRLEETARKLKKAEETANLRLFEVETQKAAVAERDKAIADLKAKLQKEAAREDGAKAARLAKELLVARNSLRGEQENARRDKELVRKQEEELRKLKRDLAALDERLAEDSRGDRSYQLAAGSLEARKIRQRLDESAQEVRRLNEQLAGSREKLLENSRRAEELQKENLGLRARIDQLGKLERELAGGGKGAGAADQSGKLAAANKLLLARNAELASAGAELQSLKRKYGELGKANEDLRQQLAGLTRRSGENARQSELAQVRLQQTDRRIQDQDRQLEALRKELQAKTALAVRLEKAVQTAEADRNEQHGLLEKSNETVELLRSDLKLTKTRLATAMDRNRNVSDVQKNLLALADELKRTQGDFQASQSRIRLMNEQLERKDKQIEILAQRGARKGTDREKQLVARVAELGRKLEGEEARRKELEVAVIRLENEKKTVALDRGPGQGPALVAAPDAIDQEQKAARGELLRKQRNEVNDLLRKALQDEKAEKNRNAAASYRRILQMQPDNRLALKRMGMMAVNSGNYQETVRYLKEAFRLDTDDMDTLNALGYAMSNLNQPEWAVAYLARASALKPKDPELAKAFGEALIQMGWKDAAFQQFDKAYRLNPKDPTAAFNLAVLAATAQPARLEEARKWYGIAVRNGAEKDPVFEKTLK